MNSFWGKEGIETASEVGFVLLLDSAGDSFLEMPLAGGFAQSFSLFRDGGVR
jgi:hypothetical protein